MMQAARAGSWARVSEVALVVIICTLTAITGHAQARGFTISGQVTCAGRPLVGVQVQVTGAGTGTTQTDANGKYAFRDAPAGTYTITPSKSGYSFSPMSRTATVSNRSLYNLDFTATASSAARTATVLVMDVSGSMAWTWKGEKKIESAKKAALQYIEQVANEPRPPGMVHEISVVTFTGDAQLALPLTSSYTTARNVVIQLRTVSSTNVGAGLTTALRELDKVPSAQRFIILLSDGVTNTGLTKQQILSGPVAEARRKRICIHTVAFGDPGYIDEGFLKEVASGSGCGTYNYAASAFELFGTYVKVRHSTLGGQQIVDFTSLGQSVVTIPGSPISLGAFKLLSGARELHYTLAWSESGRMTAKLVDPSGRVVSRSYPGATFYSGSQFSHVTVLSPQAGVWRVSAVPQQRFPANVQYYGVVSSRPGGVIPFKLPLFCIGDWCVPWPDLPTTVIVLISVIALAVLLYQEFGPK